MTILDAAELFTQHSTECPIKNRSALIADDELGVRTLNAGIMRHMGLIPQAAENGREALTMLHEHASAWVVAILDIDMPEYNGFELARKLRETHERLPLVFVSGGSDMNLQENLESVQPAIFLPKPYTVKGLQKAVRSCVCADHCEVFRQTGKCHLPNAM